MPATPESSPSPSTGAAAASPAPVERELTPMFHIALAAQALDALLGTAMATSPLTAGEFARYSLIDDSELPTTTDLAHAFSTPLTTMSDWVSGQVRRGGLRLEPHPRDGRSHVLRLTDQGQQLTDTARDHFGVAYLRFLDHCTSTPEELNAALVEVTAAITAAHADLTGEQLGRGAGPG